MAQSNLDLILRTINEGTGQQEALTGLTDMEKALAGTRSTIGDLDRDMSAFGVNLGSTSDLMSGLGLSIPTTPMQAFGLAIKEGGEFIAESISEYQSYALTVGQLSTNLGLTAEETSRLIQVSDDFGIATDTVERALTLAIQNGFEPSIESLANLADEYNALEDPVARANLLQDTFGKNWREIAPLLTAGGDSIRSMAGAVDESLIITAGGVEQARAYRDAMDGWSDAVDGLKFRLAEGLLPVLTEIVNTLANLEMGSGADFQQGLLAGLTGSGTGVAPGQGLFGRATGGPVIAGRPYVVGEGGPEVFVPGSSGQIIPNTNNFYLNASYAYQSPANLASDVRMLQRLYGV